MVGNLLIAIFVIFLNITAFSQVEGLADVSNQKGLKYGREQKLIKQSTLYSAILPGLGQAKNNKAWKIPVIYGIASGLVYSAGSNDTNYRFFKENFLAEVDKSPNTTNVTGLNAAQLESRVSFFRRHRDLSYILIGLLYFINIIDAHVDAHFKGFEVNNKLTFGIEAVLEQGLTGQYGAVALMVKFNR